MQRNLSGYYQKMISEKKDTIHVSLKEFNGRFKENIINNFLKEILFLYIFMTVKDGLMFL